MQIIILNLLVAVVQYYGCKAYVSNKCLNLVVLYIFTLRHREIIIT